MNGRFVAERRIFRAVWDRKALWLVHLAGNASLLAMVYFWLWIPDQTVTDLVLSAVSGLSIVLLSVWLHSATIAYFHSVHETGDETLWRSFKMSLKDLPATVLWAIVLALLLWLLFQVTAYQETISNRIASFLTFRLRRPVSPSSVSTVFSWSLMFVAFVLAPILLLPLIQWRNGTASLRPLGRLRYWLGCFVLLAAGLLVPYALVSWVPATGSLSSEAASAAARFLVAYAFAVAMWLLIASTVGLWGSIEAER